MQLARKRPREVRLVAVARTGDGATATRTVRVHIGPRLPAHRQETARLFRHAL